MKKILISGLILVMMSSALVGCGKNSDVSSNITSKEIAKKLIEADYLISPKEVDSDMVEEVYHLNLDDVEDGDLVNTDNEDLREGVRYYKEIVMWNFGYSNYYINEIKLPEEEQR